MSMKDPITTVEGSKTLASLRNKATLDSARAAGLLGDAKDARVAGRVSSELVAAAKKRSGLSSDTDVIEIALARLALEDDFGARLVRNKGSVPRDFDIEL
jgi:hypothetical protein